jgi:ABC-type sugar transport system ATPase subunit
MSSKQNQVSFMHPDKGLVLHQISKRFGSVRAVEQVSILSFGMRIQKHLSQKIQQSVNVISGRLGIGKELFPRTPDQLSGGQKQVVGIGRAMTILPKILLLDEPLAHVDPHKRLSLRRELKAYHLSMDIITLFVTHILPDAFALADRVAIMNEGRIIQFDSPRNIQERPADTFVKDFVECFEL